VWKAHEKKLHITQIYGSCECAEALNDLYVYDPVEGAWTNLTEAASGTQPSKRTDPGFTSVGGRLYLHGGYEGVEGSNDFVVFTDWSFGLAALSVFPRCSFAHEFLISQFVSWTLFPSTLCIPTAICSP
jgi:hypothetical protein